MISCRSDDAHISSHEKFASVVAYSANGRRPRCIKSGRTPRHHRSLKNICSRSAVSDGKTRNVAFSIATWQVSNVVCAAHRRAPFRINGYIKQARFAVPVSRCQGKIYARNRRIDVPTTVASAAGCGLRVDVLSSFERREGTSRVNARSGKPD